LSAAPNEAPPQAARRERPAASSKPAVTAPEARLEPPQEPPFAGDQSSPVAKKNMVRENTGTASTLETVKQKASSDPVVQEVIRTFAAKIVDIRLK
jgi:hypothetical protein